MNKTNREVVAYIDTNVPLLKKAILNLEEKMETTESKIAREIMQMQLTELQTLLGNMEKFKSNVSGKDD